MSSANKALKLLGLYMPKRVSIRHLLSKIIKVKMMMRHKTDEDILGLPVTNDKVTATAITILTTICTESLFQDEEHQAVFSALYAVELTLKRGLTPKSPMAFVVFGIVESTLKRYDQAYRFGKIALRLLDTVGSSSILCPTVVYSQTLLCFRKDSLLDIKNELTRVASIGYRVSLCVISDGLAERT